MSDLIDREAAVEALINECYRCENGCSVCYERADAIRALPAVAPWANKDALVTAIRDHWEDMEHCDPEPDLDYAVEAARVAMSRPGSLDIIDATREPDEAQPTAYCCHCGARPITDGSELACGCWTCSAKCWEAEVGPDDVPDCHSCPTTLASERRRAPDYAAAAKVLRDRLVPLMRVDFDVTFLDTITRAIVDAARGGGK